MSFPLKQLLEIWTEVFSFVGNIIQLIKKYDFPLYILLKCLYLLTLLTKQ